MLPSLRSSDAMATLTVPATIDQLPVVFDYLRGQTPQEYSNILDHVLLAVEELLVNVFTHAYADTQGLTTVDCRIVAQNGNEYLCVTVKDWGPHFDPFTQAPEPDLSLEIEDRPIGGLGVHLIKSVATHVRYQRLDDANVVDLYFTKKT